MDTATLSLVQPLAIDLAYCSQVNLAIHQMKMPIVSGLTLTNKTDGDLTGLVCIIKSSPAIICEKKVYVDLLPAGAEQIIQQVDVQADYAFLAQLSDRVVGQLHVSVFQGETPLCEETYPLEAYAADQWIGHPPLLCSFVTPNMQVISGLMGTIAVELEKLTGTSAIDGYQSQNKKNVYAICTASYRAILRWQINYSNPPASFKGQRVRFADAIYKYKLGTCLDTTLLFASVLEQCGLHPVIMLMSGHAYIGCHLKDYYFPEPLTVELQTIRKLVDLDDFVVFETTSVTKGSTFEEAEAYARKTHLNVDHLFEGALDVLCSRKCGILPLPLKRSIDGIELEAPEARNRKTEKETIRDLQADIDLTTMARSTSGGRIEHWRQKLLDLSLRNRLLNVRENHKQFIRLICPNIAALEDKLSSSHSFRIGSFDDSSCDQELRNMAMLRNLQIKDETKAMLESEMTQGRLWAPLSVDVLKSRLTELYRQGRTDLEEGGVNTIFLAAGFLEWPSPKSTKDRKVTCLAPILLIPVRLERVSVKSGIAVSRLDEDTLVNVTLLEMLRKVHKLDIPGVDPLPADPSGLGVDVNLVMQIFRTKISEMPGWEVKEDAALGRFSFNKFIMWNDLTYREETLHKNPIVEHLIGGGGLFNDGVDVFAPSELENKLDYTQLFCPVSADSSQLAAVLYSGLGKSFVLHGPPGTGKSQTITNIIAHNLAFGRRVLFVSEKKAALDVVYHRLSQIGLRPFCLELHSNKTGKTDVLKQFAEVLELPDVTTPQGWSDSTRALTKLRDELQTYTSHLHHVYLNNLSAYDCFSKLMSFKDGDIPSEWFTGDLLLDSTESLKTKRELISDLARAFRNVPEEVRVAFRGIDAFEWTPQSEKEFRKSVELFRDATGRLKTAFVHYAGIIGLPSEETALKRIYDLAVIFETLKDMEDLPGHMLRFDFATCQQELSDAISNGHFLLSVTNDLSSYDLQRVKAIDWESVKRRMLKNNAATFLVRFFRNSSLLNEIKTIKKIGTEKLTMSELQGNLEKIIGFIGSEKKYQEKTPFLQNWLGSSWNTVSTDWKRVQTVFESTGRIYNAISSCCGTDTELLKKCCTVVADLLPNCKLNYGHETSGREKLNDFLLSYNSFVEHLDTFGKRYGKISFSESEQNLDFIVRRLNDFLLNADKLRHFCLWQQQKIKAVELGMKNVSDGLETNNFAALTLPDFFDYVYCREMLDQILTQSQPLSHFVGENRREQVKRFCDTDQLYTEYTKKIIISRLTDALPHRRSGSSPNTSELGVLQRECAKKTRQMSTRKLLEVAPTIIRTLKPCFLMSPLSVAQYLPAEMDSFDLIVFDEASQIPVWDAIGVIARGRQLIVVGDPKQMPPTNFFQKGDSDEDSNADEEEMVTDDLESILDECKAAQVYPVSLNWHYRSRHESLISFSNKRYYEDRLFTFPSARNEENLGVKFVFVQNGVYDRTSKRTNEKEAVAIVEYIARRILNPQLRKKSLGIVTFSQAQRDLIEDMLDRAKASNLELDQFLSDESNDEPLFVKNLENVQGDERDVILFSICYAPDKEGKFYMNFGPLNRVGGERRLNVAITRAKEQVLVFSSIYGHQIDLNRTTAEGARHLKEFLDYSDKNTKTQLGDGFQRAKDDLFITSVAQFLEGHNYKVTRNVGQSACRIDLAIIDPQNPNSYLLGIECDGVGYKNQLTVRDRDSLRHSVLQGLGWQMCRLWIADWWHDHENACQHLLQAIKDAEQGCKESHVPPTTPTIETEPIAKLADSEHQYKKETLAYPYTIWSESNTYEQEFFYDIRAISVIEKQLRSIIETEAPICEKLLRKRIIRHWGFSRSGEKIQSTISRCIPRGCKVTNVNGEKVFWSQSTAPDKYLGYRTSNAKDGGDRDMEEIPPEELANAMHEILTDLHSCPPDALFSETVKVFGYQKVTENARNYLQHAMNWLNNSGRIKQEV